MGAYAYLLNFLIPVVASGAAFGGLYLFTLWSERRR